MLVVPPQARLSKIDTALVAWNGRREAARAVCDALPLLQRANRVILLVVMGGKGLWQHGDGELVRWLGTHGVQASLVVEEPSSVAGCLLQKALQVSADLLVAGGYGHSRIGELMTGGTTRTLLRNTPVPLLISH
ncbi:Universal stress protein family protein [Ralstonia sp. 25mfcol4.1]|nr:Universal stress protein family protein [Ralstonia sp. 25mfcol4.1]